MQNRNLEAIRNKVQLCLTRIKDKECSEKALKEMKNVQCVIFSKPIWSTNESNASINFLTKVCILYY